MRIPRFSPIDDDAQAWNEDEDVQAWNEDEYETGISGAAREPAFLDFSNPELASWVG